MHTAALPQNLAYPVRATGVAAWAIRVGRSLERWGRTRAARRLGAGHEASAHRISTVETREAAARAALAERDALIRSAAIPLR